MSFEQNFRAYLAFFDGTKRDSFSTVEHHLFDALYDEAYIQSDGRTLNKEQMKQLYTNCLRLGSKATVIQVKTISSNSVEFEFRMVSDKFDITIHNLGEIKNEKLVKDKRVVNKKDSLGSVLEARTYLLDFCDVERKYRDHLDVYDGKVKSYDTMAKAFEELFHEDFVNTMGGRPINKDALREQCKFFLSIATKGGLLYFRPLDDSHFEIKIHFANRAADIKTHSRGTVRDGKVVRIESFVDAKTTDKDIQGVFGLSDLKWNMHTYEQVINSDQSSVQDIEKSIDSIFHDDLTADIEGSTIKKSELKEQIFSDFVENAKIRFEKMEVVDESHIEIIISKENDWRRHQVLTVKDAKIATIETVTDVGDLVHNLNEYSRVQNSDSSTLQDMETVFESIFHDDLVSNIVEYGSGLGKEDAKRIIFKDFVERAKLSFEKMEVIDESHIEIIISKENDWRRHQILTAKDGKMIRAETVLEGKPGMTDKDYLKSLSLIASQ